MVDLVLFYNLLLLGCLNYSGLKAWERKKFSANRPGFSPVFKTFLVPNDTSIGN